jgi:hypothetical protein
MGKTKDSPRDRQPTRTAPDRTARELTPPQVRVAVGALLHWAAAYCAHEASNDERHAYWAAGALRTDHMLRTVVSAVTEHEERWRERVREVRVANLLPQLASLLEGASAAPTDEDLQGLKTKIHRLFRAAHVRIEDDAVTAVANLTVRPTDRLEKPGARRRSMKAIGKALTTSEVVTCSEATLLNHLYAKGPGPRRKGAAVRGEFDFDALLTAKRMSPLATLRVALEGMAGATEGPLVDMPLAALEGALVIQTPTTQQWF